MSRPRRVRFCVQILPMPSITASGHKDPRILHVCTDWKWSSSQSRGNSWIRGSRCRRSCRDFVFKWKILSAPNRTPVVRSLTSNLPLGRCSGTMNKPDTRHRPCKSVLIYMFIPNRREAHESAQNECLRPLWMQKFVVCKSQDFSCPMKINL
jgi:hypothetical protein